MIASRRNRLLASGIFALTYLLLGCIFDEWGSFSFSESNNGLFNDVLLSRRQLQTDGSVDTNVESLFATSESAEALSAGEVISSNSTLPTNTTLNVSELLQPFEVCHRKAPIGLNATLVEMERHGLENYVPKDTKRMLLLEGFVTYGRTGNRINSLLHAFDYARDQTLVLGISEHSWAMDVIHLMWMEIKDENWVDEMENALGVVIVRNRYSLRKYDHIVRKTAKDLFYYRTSASLESTKHFHMHIIRTLFRYYNKGQGYNRKRLITKNTCSALDELFGDKKGEVKFSVVHSRYMEGMAPRVLHHMSEMSRCSPTGAINLSPTYVRSILRPLGMLGHPIILITDGQQPEVIRRLQNDAGLGPRILLVSDETKWVGGDIMLAVMSNVFIGNPASTMSTFIARARIALGFEENYLFRRRNGIGDWYSVCDEDCIFDLRRATSNTEHAAMTGK